MQKPNIIEAFKKLIAAMNAAEEAIVDVWEELETDGFEHPSHAVAMLTAIRFLAEMETTRHIVSNAGGDAFRRDASAAFLDLSYERYLDLAQEHHVTPDISMDTPYGEAHGLAALFFLASAQLLGLPVDTMINQAEPPKDEVQSGSIH